ncbi:hypothetical protein [Legionella shakespearei]|uniref:Uncharacterized protein n=1 Tax=Legionella shakespearei DSM 23087 TaxID=1122169 RepID=A0A0W0YPU3_9GAMM|nr:hypothetical protein [Legionella shakespearei]KTD58875.1 hypothetical protein Lsha_2093 [Legionella shakespearei DSM 23087]
MKDFWYIDISFDGKKSRIGIDKGQFTGDVDKALDAIRAFCANNRIKINSFGFGYADLIIEDKTHSLTPYGVDIDMMLGFCGIDLTPTNNAGIRLSQSKDRLLGAIPQVVESQAQEPDSSFKL